MPPKRQFSLASGIRAIWFWINTLFFTLVHLPGLVRQAHIHGINESSFPLIEPVRALVPTAAIIPPMAAPPVKTAPAAAAAPTIAPTIAPAETIFKQ